MQRYSELKHTPFDGSEPLFRIGLRPFSLENWLEFDACYEDQMCEKLRLNSDIPDLVFRETPGTENGQAEVLSLVTDYLTNFFPDKASLPAEGQPDLLRAALLVQEDLVLLRKSAAGWRLVAASVCFPSSWSLPEKIGKPMHEVHGPVPKFGEGTRNATMIERIFDNLQTEHPVERYNWSIYNDDALYHSDRTGEKTIQSAEAFLRVERQTLRKLPLSGDILFTIRIHIDPFDALRDREDRASIALGFIDLLNAMDGEQLEYKGLTEGRDMLIKRLEVLAGKPGRLDFEPDAGKRTG